jgi:nucleoside-diphosphate-sugar epimerase
VAEKNLMAKIIVTGATGFTGRHLCRRLVKNGHRVIAFVRPSSRVSKLEQIGVECRPVDITDPICVKDNFIQADRVYHLAAAYRTEHNDRDEFKRINVDATVCMLDAAKAWNAGRFIHCSTVGVQGRIDHPPADEDYRVKPGDHYQQSKLEGEQLAREYFKNGLPGTIVRPVGIYGPGDTRFLKLFRPVAKGYLVMIGSGQVLYHMTYIDDLVAGFLLAGSEAGALGQTFTIAGQRYTTLKELVNSIADVLGKPHPRFRVPYYPVFLASVVCEKICRPLGVNPLLYPRRVEFFKLDRAFTIEKARKILNYQPVVDLHEGLTRTAEWYREQRLI